MNKCLACMMVAAALAQTPPVSLRVAAVQFRSSPQVDDNAARIAETLERLAAKSVNVAVFPECALTGYVPSSVLKATPDDIGRGEDLIRGVCLKRKIAVIFGSVLKVNGRIYNTAVVYNSRGELVERYGKLMLVDAEPWATPGNHIAFFDLEGVPSTVIICHDARYPEFVRLPAIAGARICYYISSETGMEKEWKFAGYRAQLMARAVENKIFVVGANPPANVKDNSGSHGQSRIIKTDGNVLQEASFFGEDVLIETLSVLPARQENSLHGIMGEWWREGLDRMMRDRGKKLE